MTTRRLPLAYILAVVLVAGCAGSNRADSSNAADLAITNLTVVDVENGRIIPEQVVLIKGNRITVVADAARVRFAMPARVIDGTGKYMMPGLWDMHAHLTLSGRPTTIELPLFVAHGVTGVRVMGANCRRPAPGLSGCLEAHRDWQQKIERGELIGPRLVALASWPVNGSAGITDSMPPYFKAVTTDDGRQLARYFKQRGVDFIKIYNAVPRAGYLGLADEARKLDLPFAGHEPSTLSAIELSNAGQKSIEHSRAFLMNCFPGADSMRKGLLRLPQTVLRRRMVDEYDARTCAVMDFYRKGLELTNAAYRAGVPIMLGTDAGDSFVFPGASVHDELVELVTAGLSPAEALKAATLSGAEYLGRTADFGAVEPGRFADLLLLDANPLADIRNTRRLHMVLLGGRVFDRQALDALLASVEAEVKR
ncbi:MAG: amidohydrolase family protein [Gemmatimonadota bacterium]